MARCTVNDLVMRPVPFLDRGRSIDGVDCYGLLWLGNKLLLGKTIPSYSGEYETVDDHRALASLITRRRDESWRRVPAGEQTYGDCVLLLQARRPIHCGMVLDRQRMLHIMSGIDACVQRYDGLEWRDNVDGFFRYEGVGSVQAPC